MSTQLVTEHHFKDLRKQIKSLQKVNLETVFDYEDPKGNKAARSHIAKMRKSKTAVTTRHKEKKADALKLCKELDSAKKELIGSIDEMIMVHKTPLDEIEDRIKKEDIKKAAEVQFLADWDEAMHIDNILNRERELAEKEAEIARKEAEIKASEFARAEAERIEKEKIERDRLQKEREEKIRKEAAEKAERDKLEAASKAKQDMIDAAEKLKKEKENAKIAADQAEQKRLADIKASEEKAELEKQAEIDRINREQAEKERLELERIAKEKAIEDARKADVEHRKSVNNQIITKLCEIGLSPKLSKDVIEAIVKNQVPNTSINY